MLIPGALLSQEVWWKGWGKTVFCINGIFFFSMWLTNWKCNWRVSEYTGFKSRAKYQYSTNNLHIFAGSRSRVQQSNLEVQSNKRPPFRSWNSRMYPIWKGSESQKRDCWKGETSRLVLSLLHCKIYTTDHLRPLRMHRKNRHGKMVSLNGPVDMMTFL